MHFLYSQYVSTDSFYLSTDTSVCVYATETLKGCTPGGGATSSCETPDVGAGS